MIKMFKSVIVIVSIFLLGSTAFSQKQKPSAQTKNPNIVLLLADDMGYAELGCYGGLAQTPNLNQLAKDGIRFTDFYSAAPNCSPSRTGLMTGISPSIVGMYNYRPPNHVTHLQDEALTIAEVLKGAGYQTGHFGKWHLGALGQNGNLNHPQPHDQGFDYSLGTENNAHPSHLNPDNFVRNGKALGPIKGYACQIVANEAIQWLDNRSDKEKPFFAYVAFQEPHAPIASPPELIEKYRSHSEKEAKHLANVENLDLAVGKILTYLKENGLMENTLIMFSSDNGSYRQAYNGDLRAVKSFLYDGGIRVPGIIHWSRLNRRNVVLNEPAGLVDVMPTICDIVGEEHPNANAIDGTSILPLIKGNNFERSKPLYWFFYRSSPEIAMRVDDMMIMGYDNDTIPRTHMLTAPDMVYIKQMGLEGFELYDLRSDKGQKRNLIDDSARSKHLKRLLVDQLNEIQCEGYYWENLSEPESRTKPKHDWVKY